MSAARMVSKRETRGFFRPGKNLLADSSLPPSMAPLLAQTLPLGHQARGAHTAGAF